MKPLDKDHNLIQKLKRKERAGFMELYDKYKIRLINFLYRYTGNYEVAKDITQETILKVVDRIDSYDYKGAFSSWIFRIAINLSKDEFKKRKNKIEISINPMIRPGEEEKSLIQTLASSDLSPDKIAQRREFEEGVQRVISSLPFIYREVLILHELEGYSYKEIANIMNCSEKNVSIRLVRARKMLIDRIKESAPHLLPKIKGARKKR